MICLYKDMCIPGGLEVPDLAGLDTHGGLVLVAGRWRRRGTPALRHLTALQGPRPAPRWVVRLNHDLWRRRTTGLFVYLAVAIYTKHFAHYHTCELWCLYKRNIRWLRGNTRRLCWYWRDVSENHINSGIACAFSQPNGCFVRSIFVSYRLF